MGIGASTNVKEIRIDQKDSKWESYPSSASGRRSASRARGLSGFGRRWINSAENAASGRRLQQLNSALEAAEKRAQDAGQRVRQLERELASLELRNMELADEATWLRKQLSDRPEVPLSQRPPTGTSKSTAGAAACGDASDAYRTRQAQYVSKLESQIRLYEEDILKLKTKMSKETQRLQAELEDQKHRSEKEIRSLDNRLIEAHKLNQKYEEVISSKISSDAVSQLRSEALADCGGTCASTVLAAATASASGGISLGADTLSQSKSRAQLILELTEQISVQQDKIRYLEDEIAQRDIELAHLKTAVHKSEEVVALSSSMRKASRSSAASANRVADKTSAVRTASTSSSSKRTVQSEQVAATTAPPPISAAPVVANEDEIEALLNNPAMLYGQDESDEEGAERAKRAKAKAGNEQTSAVPMNLSASQDLQHQQQTMNASLCSVPTSWRKEPSSTAPATACANTTGTGSGGGGSGLPPSGANPKRIISVVNTVDGNNLGGKVGSAQTSRPKTTSGGRQKMAVSPKRRQTVAEEVSADQEDAGQKPVRQASADNVASPSATGTRTHSAPMFAFKPRPSSKQSMKRSNLSTAAAICGGELPPPIDLEAEVEQQLERHEQKKRASAVPPKEAARKAQVSSSSRRKPSDSIEVLSLHEQDTNYGSLAALASESVIGDYDSPNATYDDEGDIEDGDDDDEYNSDQEIRRRFEERWKKSTTGPPDASDEPDVVHSRTKTPRPPAGGGVGQAASGADQKQRVSTSAKSQDSGFLGDSCASTNSLSLWKGRNKRQLSLHQPLYDPLDVDKLLEM